MGDPGAPVTIDIWSDFQCPACGRLARELEPRLIADHVIPGTVRIVYHDMAFLGDESVLAAIGSRYAAEQDAFWPYHDLLFANQDGENQGAFRVERLVAIAEAAGLDPVGFERSLADSAARAAVIKETQAGAAAGVSSTPTLFINGTPYVGLPDYASLSAYIDELASS